MMFMFNSTEQTIIVYAVKLYIMYVMYVKQQCFVSIC